MAITTTKAFLDLLEKSKLLTPEQLAQARDTDVGADQPRELAKALVASKILTRWQAGQLLAGRGSFVLGKYKLIDLLGRGGMGGVFLAQHTTMNRPVALKIISKQLGRSPDSLERFLTEARAIAALDHPNIVHAYSVDKEGDRYFLVMEFVEGHDLEKVVKAKGPLDYAKAADFVCQAAQGLAHAHSRNMIHCDIKPANLLVNRQGNVKILDMGMARLIDRTNDPNAPPEDRVLGTVDYLAPEQALESPHMDHRADIYSLGCTLYFLLTGHPPFPEGTLHERIMKHQTEEPKPLKEERPDAPEDLVDLCGKMMAKEPEDRIQTAEELVLFLSEWQPPKRKIRKAVPLNSEDDEDEEEEAMAVVIEAADEPSRATPSTKKAVATKGGGIAAALRKLYQERPKVVLVSGAGAVLGIALIVGLAAFLMSGGEKPASSEVAAGDANPAASTREAAATETAGGATEAAAEEKKQGDFPDIGLPDLGFDPMKLDAPSETSDDTGQTKAADAAKADNAGSEKSNPGEPTKTDAMGSPAESEDAAPPAQPEPKKEDSEQPSEEKTEKPAAEKKPAAEEKPASESPEKKEDATKSEEKPKPKPPPKKNPFSDFPELVELPEFSSDSPEAFPLGKVHSAAGSNWQILLGGAENALKSTRQVTRKFILNQTELDPAKAQWAIQLEETPSGGDPQTTDVARLERSGETLAFRWAAKADPSSANYLQNCILQLRVEGDSHYTELRRPVSIEPITLDLIRGAASTNASAKWLPETENLRVAITKVEGREGFKVAPPEPVPPGEPITLAFDRTDRHGNTRDSVEFRLTFTARSSGLSVKLQMMVEPLIRESFRKLSTLPAGQGLTIMKNQIDVAKNEVLKKLDPKDKDKAPRGEQRSLLNRQLDELEKNLWYIEFFEQVHDQAKVHFELYTEVDGRKLVLVDTNESSAEGIGQ